MKLKPRKTPTTYVPKRAHRANGVTRQQELDLRRMAGLIKNEQQLAAMMMQVRLEARVQGLERIKPYLRFKVSENFSLNVIPNTEPAA